MRRRPPKHTRTTTPFPHTTPFRSLETARTALRTAEERRVEAQRSQAAQTRQRALVTAFLRLDTAEGIAIQLQARREELDANRMTPDAHSELLNLEQTVAEAQAAASAGAAVLSVELLPSAPAVKLNGALVEGSLRVPVSRSEEHTSELQALMR